MTQFLGVFGVLAMANKNRYTWLNEAAQAADIIVPHRDNQAGPETARAASDGASPGIRPPGHGQTPD